jgi:hypothetical protein
MSLRERTRPGLGIIEPCLPSPAKASPYRSGLCPHWVKVKNPKAPAAKREAEEEEATRLKTFIGTSSALRIRPM